MSQLIDCAKWIHETCPLQSRDEMSLENLNDLISETYADYLVSLIPMSEYDANGTVLIPLRDLVQSFNFLLYQSSRYILTQLTSLLEKNQPVYLNNFDLNTRMHHDKISLLFEIVFLPDAENTI